MPMVWDASAEAKLMGAILKICDVKLSTANLQAVAKYMGPTCTPKAVTHRIAAIRKKSADIGEVNPGVDGSGKLKIEKLKTKVNGGGKRKNDGEGLNATTSLPANDDQKYCSKPIVPSSKKRSADGKIKSEPGEEGDGIQVGEDVGEGWRANNDDELLT